MTITNAQGSVDGTELKDGRVVTIAGPVVDVEPIEIRAEVAQQIGDSRVRAICLKPTDGMARGAVVHNTGAGITVPVGDVVLGHVFNVIGEPLDISSEELGEVVDR